MNERDIKINLLPLIVDLNSTESTDHLNSLITNTASLLVQEFKRAVSETNILKLSMILDDIDPKYSQTLAACLYSNKLEAISKHF